MPNFVRKQSAKLTLDDDGKDLIERAGNTDKIASLTWSQLPAQESLELYKDHYVKSGGKMVPQCYLCVQLDDHQACGCPIMAAVAKSKGEAYPEIEVFSYGGPGKSPIRCLDNCALSVHFNIKKTPTDEPVATMDADVKINQDESAAARARASRASCGRQARLLGRGRRDPPRVPPLGDLQQGSKMVRSIWDERTGTLVG